MQSLSVAAVTVHEGKRGAQTNRFFGGTGGVWAKRARAIPTLGWRPRVEARHICRFEKTVRFGIPSVLIGQSPLISAHGAAEIRRGITFGGGAPRFSPYRPFSDLVKTALCSGARFSIRT